MRRSHNQVTIMQLAHLIRSLEEHFPLQFFGRRQAAPLRIHLAQVLCRETGFKDCSEDLGHPGLLGRRAVVLDGDDDWVDGGIESSVLGWGGVGWGGVGGNSKEKGEEGGKKESRWKWKRKRSDMLRVQYFRGPVKNSF